MKKVFKITTLILSVIIISAFGFVENAKATWYNASWSYRKEITIDHTYVDSDLSNFPVLVSFDTSSIEANIQDDGDDLLFTGSDGSTKLSHEIELYDESTNTAKIWVKVPTVAGASNTTIYMYYGNASCSSQQDGTNVWDSNFTAVWHMHNDPNSAGTQQDATVNNKDGTSIGSMTTSDLVDAKIGKGWDLDGSDDGMSSALTGTSAFTWSAWVRLPSNGVTYKSIVTIAGSSYILMDLTGNSPSITGSFWSSDGMGGVTLSMTSMSTLSWYYVTFTRSGNSTTGGYKAYKDGAYTGQANTGAWTPPANAIYVGQRADNTGHDFIGIVDEVRISNSVRGADWIKFEYYNMNESDNEISFGAEETPAGNPGFSAGPSDGGSSSSSPTVSGNNVTFTATATDGQSDNYYLAICKTNSVTANNNSAPTCGGGNWCISSSTTSGSQASCNYASQAGDGSKAWYAFVCDYNASSSCSASSQGSGTTGSPFYVIKGYNVSIKNTATYSAGSWLSGWSYRKKIVISKSKVDADLTDFPLLVKLNADTAVGTKGLSTGYDLRFTSSDGTTLLAYERESFAVSSSKATANIWVKVPTITTASDTVIYMYYGKADAVDGQDTTNVWSNGFVLVSHLGESSGSAGDSTGNGNTGTFAGNLPDPKSAVSGYGQDFDGTDPYDYVNYGDVAIPTTAGTFSVWMNSNVAYSGQIGLWRSYYSGTSYLFDNVVYGSDFYTGWKNVSSDKRIVWSASSLSTGKWYKYDLTWANGGSQNVYLNLLSKGSSSSLDATWNTSTSTGENLGAYAESNSTWNGLLDELRISNVVRSDAYRKFEYYNMASATNQLAIYPQEQNVSAKTKSANFKNSASWLSGWSYRKKIVISKSKVDADLTDFPLLVKLNADTAVGTKGLSTGYDLRFTSSDGTTLLAYERESFAVSSSKATANIWVKVPTITTASDTVIYMYYGKADAVDGASQSNVWNSNYTAVWHLNETGTNPQVFDATSNNTDSTSQVWTPTASSKIAGGAGFGSGKGVYFNSTNVSTINSVSFWVKLNTIRESGIIGSSASTNVFIDNLGPIYYTAGSSNNVSVNPSFATGIWYYMSIIRNGTSVDFYKNGVQVETTKTLSVNNDLTFTGIGILPGYSDTYLDGYLDELRVSTINRSASWAKFEYYNMASTNNQLVISAQEQNTSASFKKR